MSRTIVITAAVLGAIAGAARCSWMAVEQGRPFVAHVFWGTILGAMAGCVIAAAAAPGAH